MNEWINKIRRFPRTLNMLTNIEWGQYHSRGIINYLKLRSKSFRSIVTSNYPKAIQVEPYGGCNIRCSMCFQGKLTLPADNEFMDMDMYRRIIDEVSPFTSRLYLFWRGEPLLHPKLGDMITYARTAGLYVFVSTNAVLLDKRRAQELIDTKLDFLLVGLDGASKNSFEAMRRGAKFEQVVENVHNLIELKKIQKALVPHVSLQFIVSSLNNQELQHFYNLAREIGADSTIEKMLDVYANTEHETINASISKLHVDGMWSKYKRIGSNLFTKPSINKCEMSRRLVIRSDGHLNLCCYDFQEHYAIASAHDDNVMDLWNKPSYWQLRMMGQNRKLDLCENCGAGVQR